MLNQAIVKFEPHIRDQLASGYAHVNLGIDGPVFCVGELSSEMNWRNSEARLKIFWLSQQPSLLTDPFYLQKPQPRRALLLVPSGSDGRGHPVMISGKFLGFFPNLDLLIWYFQ